jgi:Protein of unknown function (DUF3788)
MDKPILKDESIYPSADVLSEVLGRGYPAYEELMETICREAIGLEPLWRYYKDGNAWLCKIVHKKKTIIWLSVWADCFKIGLYFNERTAPGVYELNIPQDIKDRFTQASEGKKFKPLVIEVRERIDLGVVLELVEYKKKN